MSWTKAAIRPSGKVLCATTISAIGRGYTWRGEFLPSMRRSVAVSEYLAMHDQYVDSVSRLHFTVGSWVYEYDVSLAVLCGQLEKCQASGGLFHANCNVLKPVPQPPLEPELDLNKASGTKLFWGRPCHVDAQHGPKQEAGVQGGGTAPLVGSGAKPQKPAMICTYYNQLYNGKCYSCTQLSTLHFVINLLEPACDMLARGWPRAGTRN